MAHTIIYNPEEHVIEATIQGNLTLNEAKELIAEFAQIVKEKNCTLFINDYREATIKLSTMEIYGLPKTMIDVFTSLRLNARLLKRAFVVSKDLNDYFFYETVTLNSGQNAKVFFDIDEAKKWLFKKS